MSDSPQLLPDSPTDTPFQLLKAYEFWNFTSEEPESRAVLQDLLGRKEDNVGVQWLTALDGENKRGFFAWPHGHRSGIDYFRLDDHVWIWNAIRAVAAMNSLKATSTKSPLPKWEIEWKNLMRAYEPGRVKREIIQRFTTINDPAKQRMLAVTRSSRETRFAFHSRDTALFYEINGERMLDGSDPRWYSAMEIQRHFFSNLEWGETENPLYHGLNILMALRGVPLYGVDADKLFQRSKETLENSIPINGLIPDQLDGAGADEGPPYHRDSLLHIPFETLYLLSGPGKKGSPPSAQELESHKPEDGIQDSAAQRLERTVPFNDKIDEKNIINVKEEWLYNYPDFLDFDPSDSIEEQLTEEVEWNESLLVLGKEIQDSWPYISLFHIFQDLVLEAIFYWWDARKPDDWEYKPTSPPSSECQHLMIDVQKKKSRDKKALRLDTRVFQSNEIDDSWGRLKKLRDINNAKKRLLWFLNAPRDYALMCYLGSSPSERQQIRTFFNRHVNYVIFVEDKTNRVRNLWETEFHCGFLQLIKKGDHSLPPATCEMLRPAMDKLPELDEFKLVRAAVSFRFCGDFFDRFWTCHFIESYPGERPEGDIKAFFSRDNKRLEGLFSAGRDHVWQQRKILELLLFNRILAQINVSTRGITDMIREELATKNAVQSHGEEKKGLLGPYDTAVYFKTLKKWASLHEMLEVLDDELGRIWENVNAWQMREQDRRTEQPRWTNNDERKYRDALNAVFLLSQNAERELHGERSKVASFIKSLQYQSEEAKNNYDRHMTERSFQQNDNVKYFTYATVIFQPLAFAASIYSMQSSPPTEVLQHMVICSVVAFVVLLIIVISLPFFLRPNQLWHFFLQNLEPVLGGAEPVIWWFGAVAVAAEKGLFFKKGGFALLKYLWFVRQSSKPNVRRSDVESGLKNGQSKATVSFRQAVTTFEAQAPLNGTVDWWHTEAPDGNSGLGALTRISP
ncbi:hypothetical protein N7454_003945 [Penicillium verhagenii]|nr:hypothetical protein N7454_003945 [Penicillium verhagenii]